MPLGIGQSSCRGEIQAKRRVGRDEEKILGQGREAGENTPYTTSRKLAICDTRNRQKTGEGRRIRMLQDQK